MYKKRHISTVFVTTAEQKLLKVIEKFLMTESITATHLKIRLGS